MSGSRSHAGSGSAMDSCRMELTIVTCIDGTDHVRAARRSKTQALCPSMRHTQLTCCGPHEAHACDLTHRKGEGVGCRHESGHCVGHGKTRQNDEQAPKGAGQHSGGAWPVWRLCQAGKHEPSHLCKRGMQRGACRACDVAPKIGLPGRECPTFLPNNLQAP
eukprot:scaffold3249_cov256-Prasinococcus_capsulatus_cf.AAC.1